MQQVANKYEKKDQQLKTIIGEMQQVVTHNADRARMMSGNDAETRTLTIMRHYHQTKQSSGRGYTRYTLPFRASCLILNTSLLITDQPFAFVQTGSCMQECTFIWQISISDNARYRNSRACHVNQGEFSRK